MDRALDFGSSGCRFDSYRSHNFCATMLSLGYFFIFHIKGFFFKNTSLPRFVLFPQKISQQQREYLKEHSPFFEQLTWPDSKYFEHRLVRFMEKFKFVEKSIEITEQMEVHIAATAIELTFGMHQYLYDGFNTIILYPTEYPSPITNQMHKGEANPKFKILVLSWEDFLGGHEIPNDNLNLGFHEFTHALHIGFKNKRNSYSAYNFNKYYTKIIKHVDQPDLKEKLLSSGYFRDYAFENQYEFLAVLVENFHETPVKFKKLFPKVYKYIKKMLNK